MLATLPFRGTTISAAIVREMVNRIINYLLFFLIFGITSTYSINTDNHFNYYLIKTRWGQDNLYKKYTPNNELLGCWSVAAAQIMFYYKMLPKGIIDYKTTKGYKIYENLSLRKINLNHIVNEINSNSMQNEINATAYFLYINSIILKTDFGTGNILADIEKELPKFYKIKVKKYTTEKYNWKFIKNKIRNEMSKKRPVFLFLNANTSNGPIGHALVIDGLRETHLEFKVHLNFGSYGIKDGWYNIIKDTHSDGLTFDSWYKMILTIEPIS